jgi:putative transposase
LRATGGRPGDRIGGLPVATAAQPGSRPTTHLPIEVLQRPVEPENYTSASFAAALAEHGARHSVGRTGICYDNAMAESFFAALKNERVHRTIYPTRAHARTDIIRYIEFWYNTTRLHSGLRYKSPQEALNDWLESQAVA